jgi:hypothetical protein
MGAVINPSASTPEQMAAYQAEERAAMQRHEAARLQQEAARAAEDQYLKNNPPPPPPDTLVNYYNDLWSLTAPAATKEGFVPHPEIPGATSGQLHASEGLELKDRGWAAQQNAMQGEDRTPEYHPEAPVVIYRINLEPTDMERVHREANMLGEYATRPRDINDGAMKPDEIAKILSLPTQDENGREMLPTHVSDFHVKIGTEATASRPESGRARQFKVSDLGAITLSNTRHLG